MRQCMETLHIVPIADTVVPVGISVYCIQIDLAAGDMPEARWLAAEEHARAVRFICREGRARFVQTRIALRMLLAAHLGGQPDTLTFSDGPHGKPFLVQEGKDQLHFNVSHSGKFALIALADRARFLNVGIDIEHCQSTVDLTTLLRIAFMLKEQEAVMAEADAVGAMYCRWTGKEAVLKASGLGIAGMEIQQFSIYPREGRRLEIVSCFSQWEEFSARQLDMPVGYAAAIAWRCR